MLDAGLGAALDVGLDAGLDDGLDAVSVCAHLPACEAHDSLRRRGLQEVLALNAATDVLRARLAQPLKGSASVRLQRSQLQRTAKNLRRLCGKVSCTTPGSAITSQLTPSVVPSRTSSFSKKPVGLVSASSSSSFEF